ncbi:MAG TPA: zinc ribbon domain-containing protein [Pyrinomonadaceae bacterium]|nr:zinc ribbon domain-containing protein [Pyrinomonadaceae bacterium]
MFCPKCATQNVDGASFCRSCGANISLIPHALSGQLPTATADDDRDRDWRKRLRKRPPSLDAGIRNLVMGIAFIVVSILVARYSPMGWTWWYWLLIPASTFIGRGISEIIRAKQAGALGAAQQSPQLQTPNPIQIPSPRNTSALMPPVPSVTEGTTRHLGAEAPTQHFDSLEGGEKPS